MTERKLARMFRVTLFISLAATLLGGNAALAQKLSLENFRATEIGTTSVKVKWDALPGVSKYTVYYEYPAGSNRLHTVGTTSGTSYRVSGLRANTRYYIDVSYAGGNSHIKVRTAPKSDGSGSRARASSEPDARKSRPLPVTCPHLPSRVVVNGYTKYTQCRLVDQSAIGRMDVLKRGFIDAVDVWGYPSDSTEVCFRNAGWLVFLDAAYTPRKLMPLLSFERNGMTCGLIDRAGTVVLLREPMTFDEPIVPADPIPAAPVETSSVSVDTCFIKLVETLFLRAEPAGEIIGLVWLNSEVPVYEINGDWYKIEFHGETGYISRFYRKVLRGDCG